MELRTTVCKRALLEENVDNWRVLLNTTKLGFRKIWGKEERTNIRSISPSSRIVLEKLPLSRILWSLEVHRHIHNSMPPALSRATSIRWIPVIPLIEDPFNIIFRHKWVPVNTAERVFRLRMDERPPTCRLAANILTKQSLTTKKGWFFSLGVGRGANNSSP